MIQVINLLTEAFCFDIICLGEVSAEDIALLREKCAISDYSVYEGVTAVGRTAFDVCVLFRKSSILALEGSELVSFAGNNTLKVAQRIVLGLADNETTLNLFVSHWPSRLRYDELHAHRHHLGLTLRGAVNEALGPDHTGHAIVLGDFNDEPFSPSLRDHLMASRDRALAARKTHLLYNPFWRHMSPTTKAPNANPWLGGSYHYRAGQLTQWHTFDQIIFSSSFLGNSDWHLRDETVSVLDFPPYTQLVLERTRNFDHLPVIAAIERKTVDG